MVEPGDNRTNLQPGHLKHMIVVMAEHDAEATTRLARIISILGFKEAIPYLLILDDMNIRGCQIVFAVDYVNNSYNRLLALLRPAEEAKKIAPEWSAIYEAAFDRFRRDRSSLVAEVNRRSIEQGIPHRAVIRGARHRRQRHDDLPASVTELTSGQSPDRT